MILLFAVLVSLAAFASGFRPIGTRYSPVAYRFSMNNDQTSTESPLVTSTPISTSPPPAFDVFVEDVQVKDIPELIYLAGEQFRHQQDTVQNYFSLQWSIISLFIPKVLFPDRMGHKLIGLKMKKSMKLIGFVDLSLQPCDGTLKALKPLILAKRKELYSSPPNLLQPYLCNLLVAPSYRGAGLGKLLVKSCQVEAKAWGYDQLFLHAEPGAIALNLYLKLGFNIIKDYSNVLFLSCDLTR